MSGHHCHADGCTRNVPPRLLMCGKHWRMVPQHLQDRVWATYLPGQEITKTPSNEYLIAARNAINAVAEKENRPTRPTIADLPKAPTLKDFG